MLETLAPAKINLSLHVLGRRDDGYHELDSLVVFADRVADRLRLDPDRPAGISVSGTTAGESGAEVDNLVLKAMRALEALVPGLKRGHFHLEKSLPVAAGLGGGSSDAAAALRLLAALNGLDPADDRLAEAARRTGADVPVCLDAAARSMRGIGEVLGEPLELPTLPAILVNCGRPVATASVFRALGLAPGERGGAAPEMPLLAADLVERLRAAHNDLEAPAIAIEPMVGDTLGAIAALPGTRLTRMSGSGATCFGLFDTIEAAELAASRLAATHRGWWIAPTRLGTVEAGVRVLV